MDFFGKDNMSLDVSGQVHKVHGCMTENFHPASRAPGIGMPLPCGHFYFSCDIFDVRCRIGSDISTPNWKLRSQRMGLLTCSRTPFSLFPPLVDPRYVMLRRVVETCATQPTQPPSSLRKGKSGSVCAMEVVHVQE